jgi:parallel beta helix pectate lyase-like protein/uncharacterized protein DUF1565
MGSSHLRRRRLIAGRLLVHGLVGMVFVSMGAPMTQAATYVVAPTGSDSNNGSAAAPWRSIQRAANVVNPGDVVNVQAGDYPGYVSTARSGTASARIRFVSVTSGGARIRYGGAGSSWQIWLNRASYIDIEGFDVSDADQSGASDVRNGIQSEGSQVRIMGNHVHHLPNKPCGDPNGGAGIATPGTSTVVAQNHVHHIGRLTETTCNAVHGIYWTSSGARIENNIVHNNQGCGLHGWHQPSNSVIVNNLSFHNGVCGLVIGGDGFTASGMFVANNILYGNLSRGMYESGTTGANTYQNNLVFANATNTIIRSTSTVSGTIVADPQFVDYRADGSGQYQLRSTSPAIDAGTSTNAPTIDFTGRARPQGAGFDIGPYEYSAAETPSSPTYLRLSGSGGALSVALSSRRPWREETARPSS